MYCLASHFSAGAEGWRREPWQSGGTSNGKSRWVKGLFLEPTVTVVTAEEMKNKELASDSFAFACSLVVFDP